jgi:hypothetical protein
MNLVNVLLDKQFKLTLLENNKTDNIIFCKPFEDSLHNLCSYTTRNEDFIYRYVLENGERYIITDILLENGTLYRKVKFKLVTTKEEQIPYSVINLKTLPSSDEVLIPIPSKPIILKEQIIEPIVPEPVKQVTTKEIPRYDAQEDISKVKLLEQELLRERTRLENEKKIFSKQKLLVDNQNTIQSTIESFKEELIHEFHNISQRQEGLFKGEVSSNVAKIKEQNEKIQDTFGEVVKKMQEDTLYKLKETIKTDIQKRKQELETLVENKSDNYVIKVVEKANELKSLFNEKLAIDLQQYKEKLTIEMGDVSKKYTQEFLEESKEQTQKEIKSHIKVEQDSLQKDFDKNVQELNSILEKATQQINSRIPLVEEKIKLVQEKINELNEGGDLLEEARKDILLDSKKYTDTKVNQAVDETRNYARRILDLGGGGGSVAVQYANGGIMNGDLNVTGNYLSGGVNLLNILSGVVLPNNIAYTNQDTVFEKNLTIQGNLTALGTSTFQNTIFTTTSALSVINTGPGPSLYVYQQAGPYDVASFYDGDGIEVLHVGNAQGGGNPLGQVGINTSFPYAELTVNGAISSNGVITVLGGNSNQWNSAYSTVCATSAFYISNTITPAGFPGGYTFSNSDNLRTYHVDTTTAAVSVIFPSTLSNNFSVTLITLGTNMMQVSSTQTPFLCANGSRVFLPYASTLIYKYNNLLWGLGSFT